MCIHVYVMTFTILYEIFSKIVGDYIDMPTTAEQKKQPEVNVVSDDKNACNAFFLGLLTRNPVVNCK